MTLNRPAQSSSPPPLPPRVRKNTDCSSLQRSYTTPESEMSKKKWNLFENVFGKSKRGDARRRDKAAHAQPRELQLLKAKRNSFSSPDLSHLDVSFNHNGGANCSFDLENPSNISSSNSYELENLCEEAEHVVEEPNSNISRNIKSNFELPLQNDISSVNLVGSSYYLNGDSSSPKSQPATSPPGYLEMRPGKGFDMKKVEELDAKLKEDEAKLKNDVLYHLKYSFESPITYKREFDYAKLPAVTEGIYINEIRDEPHYVCMTKGTKVSPQLPPRAPKAVEPTYVPMNRVPLVIIESQQNTQNSHIESTKASAKNKRHSVDEKIASYYPNYDVPVKLNGTSHFRSSNAEGVVVKRSPPKIITTDAQTVERKESSAIKIPARKGKRNGSFSGKQSLNDNNNNGDGQSPDVSKKYATLSRMPVKSSSIEQSQLTPDTIKKSGSISPTSIKRFASLPRFKKIDFSPLRLKISNVLQRHNS